MLVALANGWRWPNVCGGQAACGVCVLEVRQGMENASPIGRDEALRLRDGGCLEGLGLQRRYQGTL